MDTHLGEAEKPDTGVGNGLLESLPGGSRSGLVDLVSEHTGVGELLFFLVEPLGGERRGGEEGVAAESDDTGGGSFRSASDRRIVKDERESSP